MHFHSDFSRRTMQISLHGDSEYAGGRLVFATRAGFVVPSRPAGSACIHTYKSAHGVTTMLSGVRYGLFFCDTKDVPQYQPSVKADLDLGHLNEVCKKQLQFYARVVDAFSDTSEDDLYAFQNEYRGWIASQQCSSSIIPATFPNFAMQVFQHVHMLHPQSFSLSCGGNVSKVSGSVLDLDLVPAFRKQLIFMSGILALEGDQEDGTCGQRIDSACAQYVSYLQSLRQSNTDRTVPSLWVDHVWHTHMCMPERYASDCRRICGFEVDHIVLD